MENLIQFNKNKHFFFQSPCFVFFKKKSLEPAKMHEWLLERKRQKQRYDEQVFEILAIHLHFTLSNLVMSYHDAPISTNYQYQLGDFETCAHRSDMHNLQPVSFWPSGHRVISRVLNKKANALHIWEPATGQCTCVCVQHVASRFHTHLRDSEGIYLECNSHVLFTDTQEDWSFQDTSHLLVDTDLLFIENQWIWGITTRFELVRMPNRRCVQVVEWLSPFSKTVTLFPPVEDEPQTMNICVKLVGPSNAGLLYKIRLHHGRECIWIVWANYIQLIHMESGIPQLSFQTSDQTFSRIFSNCSVFHTWPNMQFQRFSYQCDSQKGAIGNIEGRFLLAFPDDEWFLVQHNEWIEWHSFDIYKPYRALCSFTGMLQSAILVDEVHVLLVEAPNFVHLLNVESGILLKITLPNGVTQIQGCSLLERRCLLFFADDREKHLQFLFLSL